MGYAKINHKVEYNEDYTRGCVKVEARIGETKIGELVATTSGLITSVYVAPEYRRRKVATALYHACQAHTGVELIHQPPELRTPDGDAWAYAVGGPSCSWEWSRQEMAIDSGNRLGDW